ncbi:MAG TPA: ATP-dependent DNA helicase [Marmoricola sp.]|nr:ATP-dependent DNA helicase [Marmoricola sp.]
MSAVQIATPVDLQLLMQAKFPPSEQQWAAITAPLEPAVVIAGAGSGKTTLMAARVVYLVLTGQVRPEEVLGLTFTTKSAADLRERIRDALAKSGALPKPVADGEEVLEPTVITYNAYAANLLTDHGLRIGHEPDTRVITDASRYQLGARAIERYTGDISHLSDHPPTVIQNLLALESAMSEHLVSAGDVMQVDEAARAAFEASIADEVDGKGRKTYIAEMKKAVSAIDRRAELLGLVASYRSLKADLGLMDFSDQIALGARLAAEQPDVGAQERSVFKAVMLDEYQDTSVAQATMLSRLFSGPAAGSGRGHPVTAVGDPNQAIYGWRGASVSNILNFGRTFPHSDPGTAVPVLPLTVNRRSDRRILEVANKLAQPLYAALPQVRSLEPSQGAAEGEVGVGVFETHAEELSWLVDEVRAAHDGLWSDIGVLTRDNTHAEEVFDALTAAGVPVEIVGLSGLLRLPEVAEVVAVLHLLHDVTANAAMLTLLTGPRWAIGPRDLRLLASRAGEIAGRSGRPAPAQAILEQLGEIADGVDPAELPALSDALEDPGEQAYSTEARDRFELLAAELRILRRVVGEPLLDVVRRIIDVTGVDIELASSVSPAAAARRDNLDLFVKGIAEFQAIDGGVTLPALLAYLTAEDDQGNGLDIATPTLADSVKLLTVHRSKGLEWKSVFLVGVCETRFPSNRSRTLWTSSPAVLPGPLRGDAADLPQLTAFDKAGLDEFRVATREHGQTEELRLGYVAFTRAAHRLSVTSYLWTPRATAFGPSSYQEVVRGFLEERGEPVERWLEKPEKGAPNPYAEVTASRPWPAAAPGEEIARRLDAADRVRRADMTALEEGLDVIEAARVAEWDEELERLLIEARTDHSEAVDVALPGSLSATSLARLAEDPDGFLRDLARPMPRQPSQAARFGTRFHAWVESRFGQQGLLDPDDLAGRGDAGIEDDADLQTVIAAFEEGPFAERVPYAVEAPFSLVLDGQVVRGRIDAVYAEPDGADGGRRWLVVDWKTGSSVGSDPLQLALYRQAWADLVGVPVAQVRAVFHYVRSGQTVEPAGLPGRDELESALADLAGGVSP